jgi:hypothetical protein
MHGMEPVSKNTLADIIDRILPLNYVPDLVQSLYQLKEQQFGLVEGEASTWSLAEIIMAGHDQAPARFKMVEGALQGLTAKDYDEGPEVGPGEIGAEMTGVLPAVRDVLYHLLARLDVTPQNTGNADVSRQIDDYVVRLKELLRAESNIIRIRAGNNMNRPRTIYYVLKKMPEADKKREFLKVVLGEVYKRVPQLVFIELAPFQKYEQETEVEQYLKYIQEDVRARVIRT